MVASPENGHPDTPFGDSLAGARLLFTNEPDAGGDEAPGAFRFAPARLTLVLSAPALRRRFAAADRVCLRLPAGWRLADGEASCALAQPELRWTVEPAGHPEVCRQVVACAVLAGEQELGVLEHAIPVELRGASQFAPARNTLPFRNAASDFGPVEPRADLFARTYRPGGTILPRAFFRGLYRDIVFLSPATDARGSGGLCTGMARFALQESLRRGHALAPAGRGDAMREVQVWHGRQLNDRALLAAARQFFAPSPAAAYLAFRRQVLARGRAAVAFDVGIARWEPSPRKLPAIARRLVAIGHTITPYAFRQIDDATAEVAVYDPSYPDPADWPENVVRFDLARDRYAYRGFGALDTDDPSTVLAVEQGNFAAPGTAYLASLASLALHPATLVAEVRAGGRRWGVPALALALALLIGRARPGGHIPQGRRGVPSL